MLGIHTHTDDDALDPEIQIATEGMCSRYMERGIHTISIAMGPSRPITNVVTKRSDGKPMVDPHQEGNFGAILTVLRDGILAQLPVLFRSPFPPPIENNRVALITIAHGGTREGVVPRFLASLIGAINPIFLSHGLRLTYYMIMQCKFATAPTDRFLHKGSVSDTQSYLDSLYFLLRAVPNLVLQISAWNEWITVHDANPTRRKESAIGYGQPLAGTFTRQHKITFVVGSGPPLPADVLPVDVGITASDSDDDTDTIAARTTSLHPANIRLRVVCTPIITPGGVIHRFTMDWDRTSLSTYPLGSRS